MPAIPNHSIEKVKAAGLEIFIWSGEPDADPDSPFRYHVYKPDPEQQTKNEKERPGVRLLTGYVLILEAVAHDNWSVWSVKHTGGKGPADYVTFWPSPEPMIDDVIDFFKPGSMRLKAKEQLSRIRDESFRPDEVSVAELARRLEEIGCNVQVGQTQIASDQEGAIENIELLLVTCPQVDRHSDPPIVVRICRGWRGAWNVECHQPQVDKGSGEFNHFWCSSDDVMKDMQEFWQPGGIRRQALCLNVQLLRANPTSHQS